MGEFLTVPFLTLALVAIALVLGAVWAYKHSRTVNAIAAKVQADLPAVKAVEATVKADASKVGL